MQHNYGAAKGNMSLDGGYEGSIDQAIANLRVGRNQGRQQGLDEGYNLGVNDGLGQGYKEGWAAAVTLGNKNMEEQLAYTRQHIEEKGRLKAEVEQQSALILKLEEKVQELSEENKALRDELAKPGRTPSTDLAELVSALKQANGRLQRQVGQLEEQFESRSKEYADQIWQYNRSLVFMNAVRGVLEDITSDNTPEAGRIRSLFIDKYKHQVATNLEQGTVKVAPENDEAFKKALPRTRQFIMTMLSSVGHNHEAERSGHDMTP